MLIVIVTVVTEFYSIFSSLLPCVLEEDDLIHSALESIKLISAQIDIYKSINKLGKKGSKVNRIKRPSIYKWTSGWNKKTKFFFIINVLLLFTWVFRHK